MDRKELRFFSSALRAELLVAFLPDRHVCVAPEAPLLHVAVADLEVDEDIPQHLQVGDRLFGV